jgi:hypothetical protein
MGRLCMAKQLSHILAPIPSIGLLNSSPMPTFVLELIQQSPFKLGPPL